MWEPVTVEAPDVFGGLAVFPLCARPAVDGRYLSFAAALACGVRVSELPDGGVVSELLVANPLDVPVLIYEGEEVRGGAQNRVIETSTLVPARTSLRVPVRCVEAGRWEAGRPAPATRSPQAAYPALRRLMNAHARQASPVDALRAQSAVWDHVRALASRHRVRSPSRAMHDVYETLRRRLDDCATAIRPRADQVGAIVAIGGRFVVLDHVSEPSVWTRLSGPLAQGYALEALDAPELDPPSLEDAREFIELLWRAPRTRGRAVGLGEAMHFDFGGLAGSGITWNGAIVALTAFAVGPLGAPSERLELHDHLPGVGAA